jgi:hypothetical protein
VLSHRQQRELGISVPSLNLIRNRTAVSRRAVSVERSPTPGRLQSLLMNECQFRALRSRKSIGSMTCDPGLCRRFLVKMRQF